MSRGVSILATLFLAACGSELQPVIDPPPTRTVAFTTVSHDAGQLDISVGTTTIVACVDTCSGTCRGTRLVSDDSATLSVRDVAPTPSSDATPGALFAVTAHQTRTTTLTLESDCGDRAYEVRVLE